jgi:hypothetical protein
VKEGHKVSKESQANRGQPATPDPQALPDPLGPWEPLGNAAQRALVGLPAPPATSGQPDPLGSPASAALTVEQVRKAILG